MSPVAVHTVFELLAYTVGFRLFLYEKRRLALPALAGPDRGVWIGVAAIAGAAIGSKLGFWIEDPAAAFGEFPDWRHLLQGKTIVGALLGGLVAVEATKRVVGIRERSGDAFVLPLAVGMAIGRLGCFFAGLGDHTYGNATSLPWGVDFGDGIARHPTQLYEALFVLAIGTWLRTNERRFPQAGDRFRWYMVAYLAFRFAIEFIKPLPHAYFSALSGIQLLCIGGLIHYHRTILEPFSGATRAWERR
ncbi:MAG TPA: prolipoprotein diacylglyceryl transferase family protein [Xanthomonadales bacterium]|nr:prolipoprotein diacylglyceryl transferase family protein [Xanthomonadales bacterium]